MSRNRVHSWLSAALVGVLAAGVVSARSHRDDLDDAETLRAVFDRYADSLVPVRYVLTPRERPEGGDGFKYEDTVLGILVSEQGEVLIPGDPFPNDEQTDPTEILDPTELYVLADRRELRADAIGYDPERNVGLVRVRRPELLGARPVTFSEDAPVELGQPVVLLGLMSEQYGYAPTFYRNTINAVIEQPRPSYGLEQPVQDLAIGGLVADARGRALGVVFVDELDPRARSEDVPANFLSALGTLTRLRRPGYPLLLPAADVNALLAEPPGLDHADRAWLGISMQALDRDLAEYWGIDTLGGIIVTSVIDGSPAQNAGMVPGDVLVEFNGVPIPARRFEDLESFRQLVQRTERERPVAVKLYRSRDPMEVAVQLQSTPTMVWSAAEYEDEQFGITVSELTVDRIQAMSLAPDTRGVVVTDMERASWAELSGLFLGDIVLSVAGQPVDDLESFAASLDRAREERPREVVFFVLRRGVRTLFVALQPHWDAR